MGTKGIEELKGMAQEDLVRLVQELQEELGKKQESSDYWYNECKKAKEDYKKYKAAVQAVANLIE